MPALVRQDLERLSRLIQQHHDTEAPGDEHAIDRVVLYIDDLDRCPTHVVVKVLEAVHLLLAFPLFVVVVAVDARWLESSLRAHYTQLGNDGAAAPSDYLEKIFQVPFWVRPLGADTRREMVRGLLTPNLAGADPAGATDDGTPGEVPGTDLSDAELPEFAQLVESFGVSDPAQLPWQQAAKLTVTGPELVLIEELSPLIDATPRAVKRFINVYLLLTSMGRGRGWALPEQGQIALLLALSTGLPDQLLPALAEATDEPRTLQKVLPNAVDGLVGETGARADAQLARLHTWLAEHPTWSDVTLSGTERWLELILRFRFTRLST